MSRERGTTLARKSRALTIIGHFDDDSLARRAVSELRTAGFVDNQIRVVTQTQCANGENRRKVQLHGETGSKHSATAAGGQMSAAMLSAVVPLFATTLVNDVADATISAVIGIAGMAGIASFLGSSGSSSLDRDGGQVEHNSSHTEVAVAVGDREREARAILRRNGSFAMISGGGSRDVAR
jgi:hypothetical protein